MHILRKRLSPKPPEDDSSSHVFTGWVEAPVFKEKVVLLKLIDFYLLSCLCLFVLFLIRPEVIPCVLVGFWCKEELSKLWNPCQDVLFFAAEQPRDTRLTCTDVCVFNPSADVATSQFNVYNVQRVKCNG